jgi:integral membrane protein (TIGR01906 family)
MLRRLAQIAVVLALPVFLVLTNVRLLTGETFLRYEYGKAGFPTPMRFTVEERMAFARASVDYLVTDAGVETLRALADELGPIYNERELRHMEDVKALTDKVFPLQLVLGLVLLALVGGAIYRGGEMRRAALRGLVGGAILTWVILVGLTLLVALNFDWFFTRFHLIFFEGDTWLFAASDTLIRLFPPQFWFDASLLVGVLTLLEAAVVGGVARFLGHKTSPDMP